MNFVPTYIPNLDNVLEGGFDKPSVVLVAGPAGSGKTTFAAQSLFNAAKSNEKCLFISTLSESPAMINRYMSRFSFFDNDLYEKDLMTIASISDDLLKQGPESVTEFINQKISTLKPTRVAIDPLTVLGESIISDNRERLTDYERRGFYFDLFTSLKSWNSLVILTGEFTLDDLRKSMVGYLADGIIYLSEETIGMREERKLRIIKMRGQKYISGNHSFAIGDEGVIVFPRLLPCEWSDKPASLTKLSTGIEGLDKMLSGGIFKDDILLISGTTGTGKTTLGMHFINEGLKKGEKSLIISLEERPQKLVRNARTFGMDLEPYMYKNMLEILYIPPASYCPDEKALIFKKKIKENHVERILFDGLENLEKTIPDDIQRKNYTAFLIDMFSCMGVTTAITTEIPELFGSVKLTHEALSGVVDNIILLRNVEIEGGICSIISILKSRGCPHDKKIWKYNITETGVNVETVMEGYESLLCGTARKTSLDILKNK